MNAILTVTRFELKYNLRQPIIFLLGGLILGQGIWYSILVSESYASVNASANSYFTLASLGVVLAIVAVLVAGQSITKDLEYQSALYLYTLPINSRAYFAGRFLGAFVSVLLLATLYPMGVALAASFVDNKPIPWLALIDGYLCLVVEHVFVVVSLTFSLTVFLRSIRGAYIALFLTVLYFLLSSTQSEELANSDLWLLLDPFGVGMIRASVDDINWTADSTALLSFSDMLFINRLLWLGIALGLLTKAEASFSFDTFGQERTIKLDRIEMGADDMLPALPLLPTNKQRFGGLLYGQTTLRLAQLEAATLIRQPVFQITALLLVILTILFATVFNQNPDFQELPITSRITALRLPMGVFICLFLLVMTNELIYYERTIGSWPIYHTMPQPNVVLLLAKLLALTIAAALLTLLLFVSGIGIQLVNGFMDIDWRLYASDLMQDGFLRYIQVIALGAFIAVIVNNRLVSHVISILLFLLLAVAYEFDSSSFSYYLYSFLPGSDSYSDLIGYGTTRFIRGPIHLLWWAVAGLFITLFLLTWNRGALASLPVRIQQWRQQFDWRYGIPFLLFGSLSATEIFTIQQLRNQDKLTASIPYKRQWATLTSISGQSVRVSISHHHPYQVQHILDVAQLAIQMGEHLFGAYPYDTFNITEVPSGSKAIWSTPGCVFISEKQGWTASNHRDKQADFIDYLIVREVLKQWIVHRLKPVQQAGDGFLRQSLPEYLSLQFVGKQYGSEQLAKRLAQRWATYLRSHNRNHQVEAPLIQSSDNHLLERNRAALLLTSIGQVWGDSLLSRAIGQFYQQAIAKPTSATADAFVTHLAHQLPDSLQYLTTYLTDQLWFDFKIGRVVHLSNGLLVEIVPKKWRDQETGTQQKVPINDLIPLVILDQNNRPIYKTLVRPEPDERRVYLPALPSAQTVIIDPLGAWPELNKRDNQKIF
ncbi:ABC transporter permease [Spirosoma fluminis]